ncbi:hypothetical protein QG083_06375 [Kingella kingae]|uniref:hypothetical protein n=1 Tax=Kingella kingae TaxID=504 RepID=UPI0002585A39|nr:hypothetical protein [Kingella kingae]EIC13544.1 hypothetical protein KKB_05525 [Kingella kingae PYKK081]MBD3614725.1 hypothetical protein [Kingella kingae]MBD3633073.1 hypothetical protein [Kingella kingae]MBD3660392.1 hypothetical protein [Kingella kingae]MDK4544871.1 hypothetical protein [Kingella kingae]
MRTMEQGYYDNREDIDIYNKINQLNILNTIDFCRLLNLCVTFVQQEVIPLSQNSETLMNDLAISARFVQNQLSLAQLEQAYALANERAYQLVGLEQYIQILVALFLDKYFLLNEEETNQQDDNFFLFLNLLFDVQHGLCTQFLAFLNARLV